MVDFDLILDWEETRNFVKTFGFEKFEEEMEDKFHGGFFSCSVDWLEDPKYICKLKGSKRDIIIGWI